MKNFEKYEKEIIKQMKISSLLCWLSQKGIPKTIYDVLKWAYEKYDPFTEDEKIILNNLPRQYRWIARDTDNSLYLYEFEPRKNDMVYYKNNGIASPFCHYEHIFKNITFEGGAVQFRKDKEDE